MDITTYSIDLPKESERSGQLNEEFKSLKKRINKIFRPIINGNIFKHQAPQKSKKIIRLEKLNLCKFSKKTE